MAVAETAPGAGTAVHDFRARPLLLVIDQSPGAARLSGLLGDSVHVRICTTAAEGLIVAGGTRPDVVLAAADVADVPCPTLVRLLRRWCGTPVIVGTDGAHGDLAGAVLQAGAAACVAHPYRPAEVLALVRSLGFHTAAPEEPELRCGALVLDPGGRTVRLRGSVIDMPPREFQLLHFLMSRPGRVVSRAQLWEQVWGGAGSAASNTVAVHVRRLRSRLGDDPRHPSILTTVGRSGYRLHPPSEVRMP
jgi:DNA-binding response OmpR family regulator